MTRTAIAEIDLALRAARRALDRAAEHELADVGPSAFRYFHDLLDEASGRLTAARTVLATAPTPEN